MISYLRNQMEIVHIEDNIASIWIRGTIEVKPQVSSLPVHDVHRHLLRFPSFYRLRHVARGCTLTTGEKNNVANERQVGEVNIG